MTKTAFVIIYLAFGGVSLFFGDITPQLTNLGVSADIIAIIKTGIDTTLKTLGAIAVAVLGLTLPTLPAKVATEVDAEGSVKAEVEK